MTYQDNNILNCHNCKNCLIVFSEEGAHDYCMEKGAVLSEKFADDLHFCCVLTNQEELEVLGRS